MGDCRSCYFKGVCERAGACEDYYDYLGVDEDSVLEAAVEREREAYRDAYAAYLREWNN